MLLPSVRAVRALCSLLCLGLFLAGAARADLVWTPQTGWRVEGGALAGLTGNDGRNALELMNKARAAEEAGQSGSALSGYGRVVRRYPNSVYAPEALYHSAFLRLKRREYLKAFDNFQQIIGRYPNTRRFNEIIGAQYRIAGDLLDGARNRIWGFLPSFRNREKGIEYFETVIANAPFSDYAPLSLMNVARGHKRLGDTEEAIDALDRLINTYPQSILAPDAYLKSAQAHAGLVEGPYYDQASTREAITYFEDFMILYPSDQGVGAAEKGVDNMKRVLAESKMKIGDFYFYKRDNFVAARVFYNEAITAYPDSTVAARARKRLSDVDAKAASIRPTGPVTTPVRKKFLGLF